MSRNFTLHDFIERYGLDVEELAVEVMKRLDVLPPERKAQMREALLADRAINPVEAEPADFSDLVMEASANLQLAKKLRELVVDSKGAITASVADVQKALSAADRALDTAAKRWQDLYNTSTAIALEEAVKSTMALMDEEQYVRFMSELETRLAQVR